MRKKTKRCTQHCCKIKYSESTIPSYFMRCTTAMRFSLRTTYTLKCKDSHSQKNRFQCRVSQERALSLMDADYLMTHLPSTQNTRYSSSTIQEPRHLNTTKDYSVMTRFTHVGFSQILRITRSVKHQTYFRSVPKVLPFLPYQRI